MKLPKYWPVAVLFGAALFYFWIDEDEPVPGKQIQQEQIAVIPTTPGPFPTMPSPLPGGQYGYQAPAFASDPYSSGGYTQYGQTGAYQAPFTGKYRFRNDDPIDNRNKSLPNPYGHPRLNRDYSYSIPVPEFQDYTGPGNSPVPDAYMTYRFRPLEGQEQSKRWQGNYVRKHTPRYQPQSPYPYESHPSPINQAGPVAEHNPLWANSWPER